MELSEWQNKICEWGERKGWDFDEHDIPEKLMLIVTEISEAMEEFRIDNDGLGWNEYKRDHKNKPCGFGIELADAVIRILHLAGRLDIDLNAMMEVKHAFNETREHRHGGKRA